MNLLGKISYKISTSKLAYLFRKYRGVFDDFETLSKDIEKKEKILIFGKAASVREISNVKLQNLLNIADYKILANSVDIDNHPTLANTKFNVQCNTRVDDPNSISSVYDLETLKDHEIKALCVNSYPEYQNGVSIERFRKFYKRFGLKLLYMDKGYSPISEDASDYGGRGLTIVQKIICQAISCDSVKKIYLVGVDFFGTKYLDSNRKKNKKDINRFYSFNAASNDPRSTHGLPLLNYICELCNSYEFYKDKKLYIPQEVKPYMDLKYRKLLNNSKGFKFI